MKTNIYPDFQCIGGSCNMTCCMGWKIHLDEDTVRFYNSLEDEFGKLIQNQLSEPS